MCHATWFHAEPFHAAYVMFSFAMLLCGALDQGEACHKPGFDSGPVKELSNALLCYAPQSGVQGLGTCAMQGNCPRVALGFELVGEDGREEQALPQVPC